MEELLKEVALSERRKKQMDSFIQEITDLLESVPETPVVEVTYSPVFLSHQLVLVFTKAAFCFFLQMSDLSWLSESGIDVPFILVPEETKGKFHMEPPESVDLIGSYPLGSCIKPRVSVDLAVTIPAVSCVSC